MARAKSSKRTVADELSYLRQFTNRYLKDEYSKYLTKQQQKTHNELKGALKRKRKASDVQIEFYKDIIKTAENKIAEGRKRESEKRIKEKERSFTKAVIKKYGYNPYRDNPLKPRTIQEKYDKNDDYYFRYLGISKYETVTLTDGTMYSMQDLKQAFEQVGINAKDTFFRSNIQEYEYDPKEYNKFIKKQIVKVDKLLTDKRLSPRDIEGMKRLMGIQGGNANIKY